MSTSEFVMMMHHMVAHLQDLAMENAKLVLLHKKKEAAGQDTLEDGQDVQRESNVISEHALD